MAAPRFTTTALSVLVVALTGCGSQVIDRVSDEPVATTTTVAPVTGVTAPVTTSTVAPAAVVTTVPITAETSTTTTVTVADTTAVSPELVDDAMLDEIDALLAELDHLFNDAAASLAAEEGELIP